MSYGMPYQGSKNRLVKRLMPVLPAGNRFVDLFCGGCAMTHGAILSGKYERFLVNDLNPMMPGTFVNAMAGRYSGETRWISYEDFHRLKMTDPVVSLCWSFGNKPGDKYVYSRTLEPYKRAMHYAVVFHDWGPLTELCPEIADSVFAEVEPIEDRKERRKLMGKAIPNAVKANGIADVDKHPLYSRIKRRPERPQSLESMERLERLESLQSLQSLERLQSLQSLERLQSLQSLESLESRIDVSHLSYDEYVHEDGDIVYCDPPYENTWGYKSGGFDHGKFWEWVRTRDYPVYVSESSAPDDFVAIFSTEYKSKMDGYVASSRREAVFLHGRWTA